MSKLRILVADANPDMRESLSQLVHAMEDDVTLALAREGQEMLNATLGFRPHLAMVDVALPHSDVLALVRHLKQRLPETRVIVLLTDDSKEYRLAAQAAGACATIAKASLSEDWLRTIICLLQNCGGNVGLGQANGPGFDFQGIGQNIRIKARRR